MPGNPGRGVRPTTREGRCLAAFPEGTRALENRLLPFKRGVFNLAVDAGVPVVLLDVTREAARSGLERARRLKPDPQFTPDTWRLVETGSCLLYTSPSPRDRTSSRMPSSA